MDPSKSRSALTMWLRVSLVAVLLSLSGIPGWRLQSGAIGPSDTTLSLGVVQSPMISSLNYLNSTETYYVVSELYLPFAAYAFPPSPLLEPVLAAGWSSSENNTVWVLNLKSGLKWDDGTPLNSTDLWYTLVLENLTDGFSFAPLTSGIKTLNSTAVEVDTRAPVPDLVYDLCQQTNSFILPYRSYKYLPVSPLSSLENFTNFSDIIASGPFVIKDYTPGANPLVFTPNPYYYQGAPKMKELDLYSYASLSSELAAYSTGQLDAAWAYGASSVITPLFQNVTGQNLFETVPGAEMGIYFNMASYPFNLTQVRQALAYSTNRSAVAAAVNPPANQSLVDYDSLTPSLDGEIGLSGSSLASYSFNLTTASQLLSSVGFKKVNGVWSTQKGDPVSINIITSDQGYGELATTEALYSQWEKAGFEVNIALLPFETYLTTELSTDGWQVAVELDNPGYSPTAIGNLLALVTGSGDYSGAMKMTLSVSAGLTNYNYTAIDGLLQRAQTYELGSAQQERYAQDAASLIAQTVPFIPLFLVYNYQSTSKSYYWGSSADSTGVFDRQALMQPQLWYDTLWTVTPLGAVTTSSTTTTVGPPSQNYTIVIAVLAVVVVAAVAVVLVRQRRSSTSVDAPRK